MSLVKPDCFIRGERKYRSAGKVVHVHLVFWSISIRILVTSEVLWSCRPTSRKGLKQPFPVICSKKKKKKRPLAIYDRHHKLGHCFKVYIPFLDLGRSIVYYMLFNRVGDFVSYYILYPP